MARDWMRARSTKFTAYTVVYIIVILGVLGAINFLANRYDKSYDSTANKQFSLSDQSIKLVKGLKQDVNIYYFDDTSRFPQARDLLDRYTNLSPKIHSTFIDPVKKPTQAKAAGYRRDLNILVDSGPRKEEAKSLTEEEVTGAMIRSIKTGERNACFLNVAGEHSIDDTQARGYSYLKQLLERDNYKVRSESLKPAAPDATKSVAVGQAPAAANVEIPKDCTVAVIGGPQGDYPQPVVDAFKNFINGGGRSLVMLDNTVQIGREPAAAENAALIALLAGWGVTVNKDLVLDLSGTGQLFGLGPEVPLILSYESHAITAPLSRGVPSAFPLSRSLDTKSEGGANVSKLFGTTEDSVAVTGVGPGGAIDPKKGKKGPLTIGAAVTLSGAATGRLVVVGTSLWAQNSLIGSRQLGNRDLFGNMMNWLMSDEDLISIRPKSPDDRPINISNNRLNTIFWLSVIIFPLAVVSFGMATWWKRR
jgi:ABC-type uncharacterized transport system involved in gliding motility auxiliary subunit